AAPAVVAPVGAGDGELVQQVALRAHDLDAVVAAVARELRGVGEVLDLALHAARRQRTRRERIDRRLDPRGRYRQRAVGVAPGVQQLQADLRVVRVHRRGDLAMLARFPGPAQLAGEGLE